MIKMGETRYEWVLLHIRNGEQFVGLVDVPPDLKEDDRLYSRCMAAELLQSKMEVVDAQADRIIELRNPHQVMTGTGPNGPTVAAVPMNLGDKIIFLRAGEVLYIQFLDDKSPIVIHIRKGMANIIDPGQPGEARTSGGLIIPAAGAEVPKP